ncbi:MAG: hypothetical protein ACXWV5_03110 [Flavitalea sp.]
MKKINLLSVAAAVVLFVFSSCTKVNMNDEQQENELSAKRNSTSNCQSLNYVIGTDTEMAPFQKTIDPFTGKVSAIRAGAYTIMVAEIFNFDVRYKDQYAYFLSQGSTTDTILKAHFDKKGNLLSLIPGNAPNENYLPIRFEYKNGKVSRMRISFNGSDLVSDFTYDRNGNVTRIQEQPIGGQAMGYVEYAYHPTMKASNQVYLHEPVGFSRNSFIMAKYMGWLPSLIPSNLLTRTIVNWEGEYEAQNVYLKNHQVDSKGNLISYEVASSAAGETYEKHNITWSCPVNGSLN